MDDNYLWEESFGDEKGRPRTQAQHNAEPASSFDSAAVLQEILKSVPVDNPENFTEPADGDFMPQAPLMPAAAPEEEERYAAPPGGSVRNLLQMAEEVEKQAHLTAQAAQTAQNLAQQLIADMRKDGGELQQLGLTACKNALLAAEAAVQAQLSAMETHAAAVNQSLAELEVTKDTLHLHSQDFIQLSRVAAQAQEEAAQAREKSERARLEYAAKQNAALSSRDALAQSKRDYESKLSHMRVSQEQLEFAQKKAKNAHQEYLNLKQRLAEQRQQWNSIAPLATKATTAPPPPPQPEPEQAAAANAATAASAPPRPRIAAITLPADSVELPELLHHPHQEWPQDEPADSSAELPEKKILSRLNTLWIYSRVVLIALALVICLRLFVLDVVLVEGNSMKPTLQPSDSLISSKLAYVLHEPQRFDIILLDAPDDSGYYIKRVIGLPNEQIQIMDGQVFIDGEPLDEEFLGDIQTDGELNTVIPDGYYFVMGDNRPASRDSRLDTIGPIAEEHINGKAICRIFPLNTMQIL